MFNSVVDANVNRVSEGLRVIEEYLRFVRSHKDFTLRIASIRKQLNSSFKQSAKHLVARFGGNDFVSYKICFGVFRQRRSRKKNKN